MSFLGGNPTNYSVRTRRGSSSVRANPQKIGTSADRRWATGRTVKAETGPGLFEAIEVWTLKERRADGSIRIIKTQATREEAAAFAHE